MAILNMTKMITAHLDTLKKDIRQAKSRLGKYKTGNKKKASFVAIYCSVASAVTTILIGLPVFSDTSNIWFQSAALITAGTLTVTNAWDALFGHKQLWVMQSKTIKALNTLSADIKHSENSKSINQNLVDDFYVQFKAIFEKHNNSWEELRDND